MPEPTGETLASTLLGAIPAPLAEQILERLGPLAERVRPNIKNPPSNELLDKALQEFFDIQRILERGYLRPGTPSESSAPIELVVAPPPVDPILRLRAVTPDRILRALEGEPPSAIAHVLSCLDPAVAGAILKGLPAEIRSDVAMRYSQPGTKNFALVNAIATVVADKASLMDDQPEAQSTDRVGDLATMLRGLPRADRLTLLQTIEDTEPDLATQLRGKLFRFDDILKIDDRPLQLLLTQLNLRTIALALKGAESKLSEKLLRNISARAREQFNEETETLGTVTPAKIKEAQGEIAGLIRQFEEEGKITLEE